MLEPKPPSQKDIKAIREDFGLSQTAAAGLVYRTVRNWQQWELGERKMDPALWELFLFKVLCKAESDIALEIVTDALNKAGMAEANGVLEKVINIMKEEVQRSLTE